MITGWARALMKKLDMLPEHIRKMSEKRMLSCDSCKMRSNNTCSKSKRGYVVADFKYGSKLRRKGEMYPGCGCNLSAKTLEEKQQCPLGKW